MDMDTQTDQEQPTERRIAVVCPNCGRGYKVAPTLLGRRLVCKDCRSEWRARRVTVEEIRSSIAKQHREHSSELGSAHDSPDMPPSAGSSVAIDMSWAGKSIGRYKARSLLGHGGMGVVWRAHDDSLRRDVALKILSHTRDQKKKAGLNLDLFMQEARAVAKLQHPSVVSIFEVNEDQGHVFLSLELMEGGTLKEYVDKHGKIEPRKLFAWMVGPTRALALAHRRGVIHRDIKPGNLMLDDHGHLKLMDFGLADVTDEEVSEKLRGKAVGSLGWVAPETARGKPTTAQSDLYSMGLVMVYAMTGKPLIHGKSRTEVIAMHQNPPKPPYDEIKGLSKSARAMLERCLAVDPGARYQNADELADALQLCANEDPAEKKRRRKSGVSIAVAATVIGVIAGMGFTLYYGLSLLNAQNEYARPAVDEPAGEAPSTGHSTAAPVTHTPAGGSAANSPLHLAPPSANAAVAPALSPAAKPAATAKPVNAEPQAAAHAAASPAPSGSLPSDAPVTDANARLPWPQVISGQGLHFIASQRGKVFHRPDFDCGGRKIYFGNLVKFDTPEAALAAGRTPCPFCKPADAKPANPSSDPSKPSAQP